MVNTVLIKLARLMTIYENADNASNDAALEEQVIQIRDDPDNQLTEVEKKIWTGELNRYHLKADMTIGDVIDNIIFSIEQPEEYERVTSWNY